MKNSLPEGLKNAIIDGKDAQPMILDLFDTTGFLPRSHCGTGWTPELVLADNAANFLIFSAYVAIPLIFVYLAIWLHKRPTAISEIPRWVVWSFALFIISCGLSHIWEISVFSWPAYKFFVTWNWFTAIASWAGVIGAYRVVRQLHYWHSNDEYISLLSQKEIERQKAKEALAQLSETIERKKRQQDKLREELNSMRGVVERLEQERDVTREVQALRQAIHSLRNAAQ